MNPHADRDRSEQPTERAAAPEAIHIPQGLADHFGISAGPYRLKQPSERAAAPDAGTTREQEVEALRAEVENWRDKAQEAGAAYANANSKHHAELDRANRLERLAETLAERAVDIEDRARAAEAIVEQVRELADDWETNAGEGSRAWRTFGPQKISVPFAVRELLAILDGAQTPQTTRQSRGVAPGAPGSASGGTETGEALGGAQGGEAVVSVTPEQFARMEASNE